MGNLAAERYCDEGATIETSTWLEEHGGPDFQARFDKSMGQAQEMKGGATGFVIVLRRRE
jgi:hypothetical protein